VGAEHWRGPDPIGRARVVERHYPVGANLLSITVARPREPLPDPPLRGLLIALALEPGRVVPKATLVDWIWGEHPPADATNALHRLVSRLRKALPEGSVEGQTDGYRLTVEPDAVDAVREGLRLTALEDRFDAEVGLGHGVDLVAAHPVRERLVAALMRALVAAGRGSEALLVYQRTREALADALGVDPSPELSRCTSRCCGASWDGGRRSGRPTCVPS
jgi:DNA-binding SARP family transcriptional activator